MIILFIELLEINLYSYWAFKMIRKWLFETFYSACTPSFDIFFFFFDATNTPIFHSNHHFFYLSLISPLQDTVENETWDNVCINYVKLFCSIPANICIKYVKLIFCTLRKSSVMLRCLCGSATKQFYFGSSPCAYTDILLLLKLFLILVSYEIAKPIIDKDGFRYLIHV